MDSPFFNPDSWMDVVGLLIITIPGIVAAIATVMHNRRLGAIKEQVKNYHSSNLRDDLTQVLALQQMGNDRLEALTNSVRAQNVEIDGLREDVAFVRGEVRGVRTDLTHLERRVTRIDHPSHRRHDGE